MSDPSQTIRDKRQLYLKKLLVKNGYSVFLSEELSMQEKEQLFSQVHSAPFLYLLPIPAPAEEFEFLKKTINPAGILLGGNLPNEFLTFCTQKNISCIDYMRSETVLMENAIATAEGILAHAILESPINLHGAKTLVIGFGRCGEILAEKLHALHAEVFISTRKETALKRAECYGYHVHSDALYPDYDFIFNTAPAMVLNKKILDLINPEVFIFDIASRPGGTDFSYCRESGIHAKLYPGLPGACSPKTSAEIIYHYLLSVL